MIPKKRKKKYTRKERVRDFDSTHNFEAYEQNQLAKITENSYLEYYDRDDDYDKPDDTFAHSESIWKVAKVILKPIEFQILYLRHYMQMSKRVLTKYISDDYSAPGAWKILKRAEDKLKKHFGVYKD